MIQVLFEDSDVIAAGKPEGIASIHERGTDRNFQALLSSVRSEKLWVVHRLDKEVSGVILFAKNASAHKCLCEQFSNRKLKTLIL